MHDAHCSRQIATLEQCTIIISIVSMYSMNKVLGDTDRLMRSATNEIVFVTRRHPSAHLPHVQPWYHRAPRPVSPSAGPARVSPCAKVISMGLREAQSELLILLEHIVGLAPRSTCQKPPSPCPITASPNTQHSAVHCARACPHSPRSPQCLCCSC